MRGAHKRMANGSGDFVIAFSTANVVPYEPKRPAYENPLGTAFRSIQDTSAFARCP